MDFNNSFLLLGQSQVGKSTLINILSGNESIKVGGSKQSVTNDVNSYDCKYKNFNYTLIDTPGYDDSKGNDPKNYAHIKKILMNNKFKIKGVLLLISFQDGVFGESHRRGLEKIVNLFPLDNFWDYIIIVFTKTFCDEDEDIKDLKKKTLIGYKEIFDTLISAFNKTKNIKKVSFSSINKVFINSKINKRIIKNQEELMSILEKNSKLDPFFHKMNFEIKREKLMILNKENQNIGNIFEVEYKVYHYYNEKGEIKKSISKPISKQFIKQVEKTEYDGQFQENCWTTQKVSCGVCWLAMAGTFALSVVCPPAALGAFVVECIASGVSVGSLAASVIKTSTEYLSNKEFNEQTVINELLLEDEENF